MLLMWHQRASFSLHPFSKIIFHAGSFVPPREGCGIHSRHEMDCGSTVRTGIPIEGLDVGNVDRHSSNHSSEHQPGVTQWNGLHARKQATPPSVLCRMSCIRWAVLVVNPRNPAQKGNKSALGRPVNHTPSLRQSLPSAVSGALREALLTPILGYPRKSPAR
jgi:hypothetical protein